MKNEEAGATNSEAHRAVALAFLAVTRRRYPEKVWLLESKATTKEAA